MLKLILSMISWLKNMHYYLIFLVFLTNTAIYAEEPTGDHLTLVCYNIRQDTDSDKGPKDWGSRKGVVSDYLLKKNASIIGLQEVRHNQLIDLQKALPDHRSLGVGREDGKKRGEYSPVFYNHKEWILDPKENGTFWLSDTPTIANSRSWGNHHTRICTWARLVPKEDAEKKTAVYIYNTHWDHQSQPARVKSALLMIEKIKSRKHKDTPYILMGDLNATLKNPAVKSLLANGFLKDHGENKYRSSSMWKPDLVPGLRIDHIFTSPYFEKADFEVESNAANKDWSGSDHHPVVLRLKE